jgi:hypothetical protein
MISFHLLLKCGGGFDHSIAIAVAIAVAIANIFGKKKVFQIGRKVTLGRFFKILKA